MHTVGREVYLCKRGGGVVGVVGVGGVVVDVGGGGRVVVVGVGGVVDVGGGVVGVVVGGGVVGVGVVGVVVGGGGVVVAHTFQCSPKHLTPRQAYRFVKKRMNPPVLACGCLSVVR